MSVSSHRCFFVPPSPAVSRRRRTGTPTLLTDSGWLEIYHGVFETMAGAVYRLGVALLDREDPSRVIGVAGRVRSAVTEVRRPALA